MPDGGDTIPLNLPLSSEKVKPFRNVCWYIQGVFLNWDPLIVPSVSLHGKFQVPECTNGLTLRTVRGDPS